jgi:uncharacterized membrane protein YfcA
MSRTRHRINDDTLPSDVPEDDINSMRFKQTGSRDRADNISASSDTENECAVLLECLFKSFGSSEYVYSSEILPHCERVMVLGKRWVLRPNFVRQSPISYIQTMDDQSQPEDRGEIGAIARELDALPVVNRLQLDRTSWQRIGASLILYAVLLWLLIAYVVPRFTPDSAESVALVLPVVAVSAFVFETLDSASGMGFGATIGALLFVLGYDPLAVTPVLLLSEAATGIVSGLFHNEFKNVEFGFGNDSAIEAMRVLGIIVVLGVLAVVVSVVLTYFQFSIPDAYIKGYVGVVVLLIASVTLVQKYVGAATAYRPRWLIGFAIFAGLNKGIAGSGYGPVITLGEIISGVYEKSATAITSMAEGIVSVAGIAAFFGITAAGVEINLMLLPSVFAGGFLAAILSPYTVRALPNRALQYLVPGYALVLVVILFAQIL